MRSTEAGSGRMEYGAAGCDQIAFSAQGLVEIEGFVNEGLRLPIGKFIAFFLTQFLLAMNLDWPD
jgi:hypothetical protein